jgi:hypothetical protein
MEQHQTGWSNEKQMRITINGQENDKKQEKATGRIETRPLLVQLQSNLRYFIVIIFYSLQIYENHYSNQSKSVQY